MPYYHLRDEQGEIKALRQMDHEVAHLLNKELTDGSKWYRGLAEPNKKSVKSLVQILRGLDTEGFNEHSTNVIDSWLDNVHKDTAKRSKKFKSIKKAYIESTKHLPPKDRQAIGAFIGAEAGRSFYAGLMLGLSGRVVNDYLEEE